MAILPYLIKRQVKFPLEMSLSIKQISLYYQILLRGFTIYKYQVAAAVILKGVFLKKYYLIIIPITKSIVAQNRTAGGFCHSNIISLLKGMIYNIKQKLLFFKGLVRGSLYILYQVQDQLIVTSLPVLLKGKIEIYTTCIDILII